MDAVVRKQTGSHYTPDELAAFMAEQMWSVLTPSGGEIRILDPACGDGVLLAAALAAAPAEWRDCCRLVGFDTDPTAVEAASARLDGIAAHHELHCADFLRAQEGSVRQDLFAEFEAGQAVSPVDAVITNPPYVRTQVMGAARSQALAQKFGLRGRVDLYQAFVAGVTPLLRPDGVLTLLSSNRFLSVKAGHSIRALLASEYAIAGVVDFGDSRLFEAAVLPAVTVAVRAGEARAAELTRVYESSRDAEWAAPSVVAAVNSGRVGVVEAGGTRFELERAPLSLGERPGEVWSAKHAADGWLQQVLDNSVCTFGDLGKIRVGIKTTADSVFIRREWTSTDPQPEAELIKPLLTHHVAAPWHSSTPERSVLYPYEMSQAKRVPVNLAEYPAAEAYLEQHRARLEGRKYVIDGGRQWWEIWVPQSPATWARPKIVFPDIAEAPRFFLDESGAVVNGDCYWVALPGPLSECPEFALLLAVANSTLGTRFYDAVCGNKLYAGRRRYITQYVSQFPIPDPLAPASREICDLVAKLVGCEESSEREVLAKEVDELVWSSFGIEEPAR